jgi:hypothetical protein
MAVKKSAGKSARKPAAKRPKSTARKGPARHPPREPTGGGKAPKTLKPDALLKIQTELELQLKKVKKALRDLMLRHHYSS